MVSPMHWSTAVLRGDVVVVADALEAGDLNAVDDVVAAGKRLGAVGEGEDFHLVAPRSTKSFLMTAAS